jgi:lipopolysaccharide export system protein LptC
MPGTQKWVSRSRRLKYLVIGLLVVVGVQIVMRPSHQSVNSVQHEDRHVSGFKRLLVCF